MQKKTKSRLFSVIFVSTCLVGSTLSLLYFFNDLNKVSFKEEKQIAFIQFKRKIAQRRFSDSVVWERLVVDSPLYNEDLISTDSEAFAKIYFENGTNVNIDEHTMIQIFEGEEGDVSLSVNGGSVDIDTSNSNSQVKVDFEGGYTIRLEKGTKVSASTKENGTNFVVHQGNVVSIKEDGSEEVLNKGQSIDIDKEGKATERLLSLQDSSYNQQVFYLEGENEIKDFIFNIGQKAQGKEIVFETSYTKDFESIISSQKVLDKAQIKVSDYSDGFYYRAYIVDQKESKIEGKVNLVKVEKPKQILTINTPVFYTNQGKSNVLINWKAYDYSDYVTIKVYKVDKDNHSKKDLVFEETATSTSITVNNLEQGEYEYKVIPHYSMSNDSFNSKMQDLSTTAYFNVKAQSVQKIDNDTRVQRKIQEQEILEQVQNDSDNEILKPVQNDTVEVQNDSTEVRDDVKPKKDDKKQKKTSKKQTKPKKQEILKEEIPKPIENTIIEEEVQNDNVEEVQKNNIEEVKKNNIEEVQDDSDNEISKEEILKQVQNDSTPVQNDIIEEVKLVPLEKPILNIPLNNYVIEKEYLARNRRIMFTWQNVERATEYEFIINLINKDGSVKQIFTTTVKENKYDFTELQQLDNGKFQWQVKAIEKDQNGVIIQETEYSTFVFEINIPLPTQVKTVEQGTMYGN